MRWGWLLCVAALVTGCIPPSAVLQAEAAASATPTHSGTANATGFDSMPAEVRTALDFMIRRMEHPPS